MEAAALDTIRADFEQSFVDMENVLGVSLTIHDLTGYFKTPAGDRILAATRTSHQHPACRIRRSEKCLADCLHFANTETSRRLTAWEHLCWRGIVEVIVPVIRSGEHLGTLFAGAFLSPTGHVSRHIAQFSAELRQAVQTLPVTEPRRMARIGRVLSTFAEGLLFKMDRLYEIDTRPGGRRAQIRRFLHYNAHKKVTLRDLADNMHLSESRTSHVVTELFGAPFRDLLVRERVRRAAVLLTTSDYTVGEIADKVGMPDEYHFNRTFKKAFGIPPGRYRKKNMD